MEFAGAMMAPAKSSLHEFCRSQIWLLHFMNSTPMGYLGLTPLCKKTNLLVYETRYSTLTIPFYIILINNQF